MREKNHIFEEKKTAYINSLHYDRTKMTENLCSPLPASMGLI